MSINNDLDYLRAKRDLFEYLHARKNKRAGDWWPTVSNGIFWPYDPNPDDVRIEDIAHSLSLLCRWAGNIKQHFLVAQHSVMVSQLVPSIYALHGLLHDAAEAYLGDLIAPVKARCRDYQELEATIMGAVSRKFDLTWTTECEMAVRQADLVALATEVRDLIPSQVMNGFLPYEPATEVIKPVQAHEAKWLFMDRFEELTLGRQSD